MRSQPLIVRTCRHVLENGSRCRCAATRGKAYCRHHAASLTRRHNMARARRRRQPLWLHPLMAARTFRDRCNSLQVALELGDLDLPTAGTLLRALRMSRAVERKIDQIGKPPGTPKSFRLYQVPASSLLLGGYALNATQAVENKAREGRGTNKSQFPSEAMNAMANSEERKANSHPTAS